MTMERSTRLLRRYIKEAVLLSEDSGDMGGYGGSGISMMDASSPFGMFFTDGKGLFNIFIEPFTDVIKTAAGKTKEISVKAQTLAKTILMSVGTVIIPFYDAKYSELRAKEKSDLEKIHSEYKSVYDSTWAALSHPDVVISAFLLNPALVLAPIFVAKAPKAAFKVADTMLGGKLHSLADNVGYSYNKGSKGPSDFFGDSYNRVGKRISEAGEVDDPDAKLKKILGSKKIRSAVIAAMQSSPDVKAIRSEASAALNSFLNGINKEAHALDAANSVADLEKIMGKKLQGSETLGTAGPEERKKLELSLVNTTKKGVKDAWVKLLEDRVKKAMADGVPENAEYVTRHRKTINAIKGIKEKTA